MNELAVATLRNYQKSLLNLATINFDDDLDDEETELELLTEKYVNVNKKIPRIDGYIVNVVNYYDNLQFQQNFRLKRPAFEKLLSLLSQKVLPKQTGRPQIEMQHQLLAVIWLLATPDSYRSVCERFGMAKSTLSRCFVQIINALNALMEQFLKWPNESERQIIKMKFGANSIFKNLIGVVDGTYVPLSVHKKDIPAYTNRKCFTSMTLQAICDSEMKYTDVYCWWPSSVPDIRIFKNSHIYEAAQENNTTFFKNDEYILGDKAYPLMDWCIHPYMDRGRLSQRQIKLNQKHSSCRQVIERSFALLFGRFRRLKQLDLHRTDWAAATITACCVLHNICLDYDQNQDIIEEYIVDGFSSQNFNSTEEILVLVLVVWTC